MQFDNDYDDLWYHRYDLRCKYKNKLDGDMRSYMKTYWFMFFLWKLGVWK